MRRIWTASIVGLWLATSVWLICFEAYPDFFTRTSQGYRSLFSRGMLIMDKWMQVSYDGSPIGYSHTVIDSDEDATITQYSIRNRSVMRLNIMGEPQEVRVRAEATLDALYNLERFSFMLGSAYTSFAVRGERSGAQTFNVVMHTGGVEQRLQVEIPDDAMLYSPMMEAAMQQLKPGQRIKLRIFNPVSLSPGDLVVFAERYETITVSGEPRRTTVVTTEYEGMKSTAWVDRNGRVIRQETPFGWEMQVCEASEALSYLRTADDNPDLLLAMAVPVQGTITDPRTRDTLTVRLRGVEWDADSLAGPRQVVRDAQPNHIDLTLQRQRLPSNSPPLADTAARHPEFLASSPFVQSDADAIAQRARGIVAGHDGSLGAAIAIHDWVHDNMRRIPTVSVPSALEILKTMTGDCNEHTYLFVALARAAGIPARIAVGIVYSDGAFYYHAWPIVFVGEWVEMDPTLGQHGVDATHIKLAEGELEDQMKLAKLMGRLSVEVLNDD